MGYRLDTLHALPPRAQWLLLIEASADTGTRAGAALAGWNQRISIHDLYQVYALTGIFNMLVGEDGPRLEYPQPWPSQEQVQERERQQIRDLDEKQREYYERLLQRASIID